MSYDPQTVAVKLLPTLQNALKKFRIEIIDFGLTENSKGKIKVNLTVVQPPSTGKPISPQNIIDLLTKTKSRYSTAKIEYEVTIQAKGMFRPLSGNGTRSNHRNGLSVLEADASVSIMILKEGKSAKQKKEYDLVFCQHTMDQIQQEIQLRQLSMAQKDSTQGAPTTFHVKLRHQFASYAATELPLASYDPNGDLAKADIAIASVILNEAIRSKPFNIGTVNPPVKINHPDFQVYFINQMGVKTYGFILQSQIIWFEKKPQPVPLLKVAIEANPGDSGAVLFNDKDEAVGMILKKYENGINDDVYAASLSDLIEKLNKGRYGKVKAPKKITAIHIAYTD